MKETPVDIKKTFGTQPRYTDPETSETIVGRTAIYEYSEYRMLNRLSQVKAGLDIKEMYLEARVAERLGLCRDFVKKRRREVLDRGREWFMRGNEVFYTEDGVRKMVDCLGVKLPEKRPRVAGGMSMQGLLSAARAGRVEDDSGLSEIEVTGTTKNKSIVLGVDATGQEARVIVNNNENFVCGMIMTCRKENSGAWTFVGRCPRWRGKW